MTIEYVELTRKELLPGYRISGEFTDTSENTHQVMSFFVNGTLPTEAEINLTIESMKENIVFSYNPLNYYELDGGDVQPILDFMVITVRADPAISQIDLANVTETEFPLAFWKIMPLIQNMRQYLERETGVPHNYEEFKLYLIDNMFKGVD